MKTIIAIKISKDGRCFGATVEAAQVANIYTILSGLLHGFEVRIVGISSQYASVGNHSVDDFFRMAEERFNIRISFQVFPLKGGPSFHNDFPTYESALKMAQLWGGQFKTPYGVSSKVE